MTVGIYKQVARDIMTKHVDTLREKETVHDALLLMAENRVSSLPVVNAAGQCVGVISQSDLIDLAREADSDDTDNRVEYTGLVMNEVALDQITNERVEDVMSDQVIFALPDDPVVAVADKLVSSGIHHLPVCNQDEQLLGFISTVNILKGLLAPVSN